MGVGIGCKSWLASMTLLVLVRYLVIILSILFPVVIGAKAGCFDVVSDPDE